MADFLNHALGLFPPHATAHATAHASTHAIAQEKTTAHATEQMQLQMI